MKLPNRPNITDEETDKVVARIFGGAEFVPVLLVVGVRGYFLNSVGKPGENDLNLWDDAILVYYDSVLVKTFNANTDPSKHNQKLAMLDAGLYEFYQGTHKERIKAFRAYPEGVELPCKRQQFDGSWVKSKCSAINIHDGAFNDTWSAGCQTVINQTPHKQFDEFRDLVYDLMDANKMKTFKYLLLEESDVRAILEETRS
ncbi:MAG TPA: hypothetical protein VIL74_09130 [Pyrinomonadaceae bacterium]|jgi:lysozyme